MIRTRFASGIQVHSRGQPLRLPIEVRVSDNGPGIDPALRDHIFEPFVTAKKHGQGLGLALVQKLVREMNGRITHDRDEEGAGPISACICPWPGRLQKPRKNAIRRKKRQEGTMTEAILLVEDDASIAIVITAALEAEGL
jgi:signal transduction histidine kinase